MGACAGIQTKKKPKPQLDDLHIDAPLARQTEAPLTHDDLPGPLPMMTPRLSRQSAFSRPSMDIPINPFSHGNRVLNLGGDIMSLSFGDDDDSLSVVSPSVGQSPFDFEFDLEEEKFVQSLLKDKKYTDFLCDQEHKKTLETFRCSYCGHVLQEPVILVPCGHEFCRECFFKWKIHFHDQPEVPCPDCSTPVFNEWFTPAVRSKMFMTQSRFRCKCVFAPECTSAISICRFKCHLKKCPHAMVQMEIKTFTSSDSITLEMRKTDSVRDCINEIINQHEQDFDASQEWVLHVGSPGMIAEEKTTVKEFFKRDVWIGPNEPPSLQCKDSKMSADGDELPSTPFTPFSDQTFLRDMGDPSIRLQHSNG